MVGWLRSGWVAIGAGLVLMACGAQVSESDAPESTDPSADVAAAASADVAEGSNADSITYDFTINVTAGPLANNTYMGSFSYDPTTVTGEGLEEIGVDDGLKASIVFFEEEFTEADDSNFPDFPVLVFEDGEIVRLDFWVEEGDRLVWWNTPGWEVEAEVRSAGQPQG